MKKFLLLLCIAGLGSSCVDNAYDFDKVDTGDITIGNDKSQYKLPLATIKIKMSEVGSENLDIKGIFREADVWLPSPLPNGEKLVDLVKLKPGTDYTKGLLDALIDQMERDEEKLNEVTNLIWDEYRDEFIPLLGEIDREDEAMFKNTFKTLFVASEEIQNESRKIAQNYLIDMHIDPLDYEIEEIDLSSDVVDMLAKNLDPKSEPNPKNTLHLYGEISSELPVGMGLAPVFTGTDVTFEVAIAPNSRGDIPETQVFENDLRTILKGVNIHIPVTLLTYDRDQTFAETQKINIRLSLIKRGGLTLDI